MMEMRLSPVTSEEASAYAQKEIGATSLTSEDVLGLCTRLGRPDRTVMIGPDSDYGWPVYSVLQRDGKISAANFAAWWIGEDRCDELMAYMKRAFEGVELLERHETLFRWRVASDQMSLSQIFANIEQTKARLSIREYSVSQTSLEQVFNQFAAQQEEETGKVRGIQQHPEPVLPLSSEKGKGDEFYKLASPTHAEV